MHSAWVAILIGLGVLGVLIVIYGVHQHRKITRRRAALQSDSRQSFSQAATHSHIPQIAVIRPDDPSLAEVRDTIYDWALEVDPIFGFNGTPHPEGQAEGPVLGLPLAFSHFSEGQQTPQTPPRNRHPPTPTLPPQTRTVAHFPLESEGAVVNTLSSPGVSIFPASLPRNLTRRERNENETEFFEPMKPRSRSGRRNTPNTRGELRAALGVLNHFAPARGRSRSRSAGGTAAGMGPSYSRSPQSKSERRRNSNCIGWENEDELRLDGVEIEALTPLTAFSVLSFHSASAGPSAVDREGFALGRSLCAIGSAVFSSRRSTEGEGGTESPLTRWRLRSHSMLGQRASCNAPAPTPFPTNDQFSFCVQPSALNGVGLLLPSSTRGAVPGLRIQAIQDRKFQQYENTPNNRGVDEGGKRNRFHSLEALSPFANRSAPILQSPRLEVTTAQRQIFVN